MRITTIVIEIETEDDFLESEGPYYDEISKIVMDVARKIRIRYILPDSTFHSNTEDAKFTVRMKTERVYRNNITDIDW